MALLLSRGDLEKILDWTSVIAAVEAGFVDFAAGKVAQPQRTVVRQDGMPGVYVLMPCAVGGLGTKQRVLGAKVASIFNGNTARGLPAISGLYLLADYDSGRPIAVM